MDVPTTKGSKDMNERRKARRYNLTLPLTIQASIDNDLTSLYGETLDISTRGVYFNVGMELKVGMKLGFSMRVETGRSQSSQVFILALGRVVRVEKRLDNDAQSFGVAAAIRRFEYFREGIPDNSAQWLSSLAQGVAQ
jgi:c-di-GMP-binding flagellar brake protein YcgR